MLGRPMKADIAPKRWLIRIRPDADERKGTQIKSRVLIPKEHDHFAFGMVQSGLTCAVATGIPACL
jgi:hypothetical protein